MSFPFLSGLKVSPLSGTFAKLVVVGADAAVVTGGGAWWLSRLGTAVMIAAPTPKTPVILATNTASLTPVRL
ncbi:hypothetical protein [Mycobacterium triplex]|uniref:hypothetical protein n=1 Tax=Mycobacterium triplex TaxID=47839 RepID=UPI001E590B3C|nr:hypothetical protein [Mycobacterium triplex]